jgi:acetylornithine aminotransferase/acetylornithine/N-succinyldiaminopimelate aminotransferase
MLARRILINRTHETTLRFLPPYIVTRKHVDQVVDALDEILSGLEVEVASANTPKAKSAKTAASGSKR